MSRSCSGTTGFARKYVPSGNSSGAGLATPEITNTPTLGESADAPRKRAPVASARHFHIGYKDIDRVRLINELEGLVRTPSLLHVETRVRQQVRCGHANERLIIDEEHMWSFEIRPH